MDVVGQAAPIRGPQRAYYQRLDGDFTKVSSNGRLTLTTTHLVFDSKIGKDVVVALEDVVDVRDQPIRRWHLFGHDSQLVVATEAGEAGFLLDDPAGWATLVRAQIARS